jgi:hypothetical protein
MRLAAMMVLTTTADAADRFPVAWRKLDRDLRYQFMPFPWNIAANK